MPNNTGLFAALKIAAARGNDGIAAVFLETHQDPDNAPSDGPNMIRLSDMAQVIDELMAFDKVAKAMPRGI